MNENEPLKQLVDELLSEEMHSRLILNALASGTKTEEELSRILNWAREMVVGNEMLNAILDGDVLITLTDDEDEPDLLFKAPSDDEKETLKANYLMLSCCTNEEGNWRKWEGDEDAEI